MDEAVGYTLWERVYICFQNSQGFSYISYELQGEIWILTTKKFDYSQGLNFFSSTYGR